MLYIYRYTHTHINNYVCIYNELDSLFFTIQDLDKIWWFEVWELSVHLIMWKSSLIKPLLSKEHFLWVIIVGQVHLTGFIAFIMFIFLLSLAHGFLICVHVVIFYEDLMFFGSQAIGLFIGLIWKCNFLEGIVFLSASHRGHSNPESL